MYMLNRCRPFTRRLDLGFYYFAIWRTDSQFRDLDSSTRVNIKSGFTSACAGPSHVDLIRGLIVCQFCIHSLSFQLVFAICV